MSNQEKLAALKAVLRETKTEFWENVRVEGTDIVIPLFLPKGRIAVRIGDDDLWYRKLRNVVHPVIIRDVDTVQFVIEKVNNTIESKCVYHREKSLRHYQTPAQKQRIRRIATFRKSLRAESKVRFLSKKWNIKNHKGV